MTVSGLPAAVILAGGRSSRMGGKRKALLELNGRSLLSRVIDRLEIQSSALLLSCDNNSGLESFDLPLVPDLLPGYRGPLTGLYSALKYHSDSGQKNALVLCPCDAPFIPFNLVQTLLETDQADEERVVAVSYRGILQPTFSLWHQHHLTEIHQAVVEHGYGSLKHLFYSLPHKIVEWSPVEPSPFFNINTPRDLETASTYLD